MNAKNAENYKKRHGKIDNRYKSFIITFFTVEFLHAFFDYVLFSDRNAFILYFLLLPLLSATIFATVGAFVEPWVEKRFPAIGEKFEKQKITKILLIIFCILIVFFLLSGFYTITNYQGAVLTKFSGAKSIQEDIGIHYRLPGFTKIEKYDERGIYLHHPDIPFSISTKSGEVVSVDTTLTYSIDNLELYAIKTKDAPTQFTALLGASLNKIVQQNAIEKTNASFNELESQLGADIKLSAENIGIKISDLRLNIREPSAIIESKQAAENSKIVSEAKIIEAQNNQRALDIQKQALNGLNRDQLDYLAKIELYKSLENNPKAIYIIPDGLSSILPIQTSSSSS